MANKAKEDIYSVIYQMVRAIPTGRVSTYGAIAAAIGAASGARLVGYALRYHFTIKPSVPGHRVLNRNGLLSGRHHYDPPEKMQQLLEQEGIKIEDNTVVDFDILFWDPMKELL
jgi:methylated-DNA-protein-cysteine methyltransferase-like protein